MLVCFPISEAHSAAVVEGTRRAVQPASPPPPSEAVHFRNWQPRQTSSSRNRCNRPGCLVVQRSHENTASGACSPWPRRWCGGHEGTILLDRKIPLDETASCEQLCISRMHARPVGLLDDRCDPGDDEKGPRPRLRCSSISLLSRAQSTSRGLDAVAAD